MKYSLKNYLEYSVSRSIPFSSSLFSLISFSHCLLALHTDTFQLTAPTCQYELDVHKMETEDDYVVNVQNKEEAYDWNQRDSPTKRMPSIVISNNTTLMKFVLRSRSFVFVCSILLLNPVGFLQKETATKYHIYLPIKVNYLMKKRYVIRN